MNIKTTIRAYHFDISKTDENKHYLALRDKLTAAGLECFETWGGSGSHYLPALDGETVELETDYLYSNQWNTAPIGDAKNGLRVFDWAQDYPINFSKSIKRGHYLEQTAEMREIRRNTNGCGYCGKQEPAAKGNVFCPHCIGSEYLKSNELYLLRMIPIDAEHDRAELTDAERAHLLPIYKNAQIYGHTERDKTRIAKARADVLRYYETITRSAKIERDGFIWCMDHGVKTDDLIFYSHTGRFCFGWRGKGIDKEIESLILDAISEFPFPYDLKTADGRTLSGN
jgi:hypothetical protein